MHDNIPIIEITDENVASMWSAIVSSIKRASFIAMDCELSGLGDRKKLNFPEIDIRYKNLSEIAHNHAIISFGLSCFSCISASNVKLENDTGVIKSQNYMVQTFNILTLNTDNYEVESAALKFLVSHGFDFNKQYSHGLPFIKGDDDKSGNSNSSNGCPGVREIFSTILKYEKPIVFHNGFVDLVFLYQNFYAELPKNIDMFSADLLSMFANGVYDTKYIAEYIDTLPASYLEFIFNKMQLSNRRRKKNGEWHLKESFPPYPKNLHGLTFSPYQQILSCEDDIDDGMDVCPSFKYHGWCSKGVQCDHSHNINKIVRELSAFPRKARKVSNILALGGSVADVIRRKIGRSPSYADDEEVDNPCLLKSRRCRKRRKLDHSEDEAVYDSDIESKCGSSEISTGESRSLSPALKNENLASSERTNSNHDSALQNSSLYDQNKTKSCRPKQSGHRAGFDAFMTGYVFACHISAFGNFSQDVPSNFTPDIIGMSDIVNRIYLVSKSFPFLVRSSAYSRMSSGHMKKIELLRGKV